MRGGHGTGTGQSSWPAVRAGQAVRHPTQSTDTNSEMRDRIGPRKIVLASLAASAVCVVLAVVAAVLSWPRLLVPLLGLES